AVRLIPNRGTARLRPQQRRPAPDARPQGGRDRARGQQPAAADPRNVGHACFIPDTSNESGSVFDMTNVRKLIGAVALATLAAAAGLAFTPAISHADGHQVTYTITTTGNLTGNVRYMNSDPASQAAFDANSSQYLTTVATPFAAGQPLV